MGGSICHPSSSNAAKRTKEEYAAVAFCCLILASKGLARVMAV
jgi:hypothetical protein